MTTTNETLTANARAAYAAWEAACDRCSAASKARFANRDEDRKAGLRAAHEAAEAEKKALRVAYLAADDAREAAGAPE